MTEILFIAINLILLTIFFSVSPLAFIRKFNIANVNLFENIIINFLIYSNIILLLSFFNLNLSQIFNVIILIFLIILFVNFKNRIFKYKKFIQNHNILIIFILLTTFIISVDIANKIFISWDSEKFWTAKVLNFYNEFSVENLDEVRNPHYPYFGALISSFFWKINLIEYEYSSRVVFAFLFCFSLILLINNFKLDDYHKIIIFLLFLILIYDYRSLFAGGQEVLIFSFIAIVMHNYYRIKNLKSDNFDYFVSILSIVLCCNLIIWTKQEGMFYAVFLILTLFVLDKKNFKLNSIYLILILCLITLKILIFYIYNLEISLNSSVLSDTSLTSLFSKITFERILIVMEYFFYAQFQSLILLSSLIIYFLIKILKIKIDYLEFCILINFIFLFFVYLLVDNQEFNIKTGINRLILNISPLLLMLFIEYFNNKKKTKT